MSNLVSSFVCVLSASLCVLSYLTSLVAPKTPDLEAAFALGEGKKKTDESL